MELLEGERVVWRGRSSWRSMLAFYIKWLLAALVIGVVAQILRSSGAIEDLDVTWPWGVSAALVLVVLLWGWLKRYDTLYVVTDRRIHIRNGIVARRDHSTVHERVQNVSTDQSVLDRLLGIGDVDFDTAGTDDYEFKFAGVAHPGELVRLVAGIEQDAVRDPA